MGKRESFKPTRGLRKGDPLSPFLFLICSEALSALMRFALRRGRLKVLKQEEVVPRFRIFFLQMIVFYSEKQLSLGLRMKNILKVYELCSGHFVNFKKSAMFYNTITSEADRHLVSKLLGVRGSNDVEKYLGLPNLVGKRRMSHSKP